MESRFVTPCKRVSRFVPPFAVLLWGTHLHPMHPGIIQSRAAIAVRYTVPRWFCPASMPLRLPERVFCAFSLFARRIAACEYKPACAVLCACLRLSRRIARRDIARAVWASVRTSAPVCLLRYGIAEKSAAFVC